jgi:hypothetical protein
VRVFVEESTDQPRQHVLCDSRGHPQGEFAGELSAFRAEFMFGLRCQCRNFPGIPQENRTRRGERDPIGGAVEQSHSKIVFERFDLERNGGLGEEQMFGGFAEIQVFSDRAEDFEAEILQLRHGERLSIRIESVTQHRQFASGKIPISKNTFANESALSFRAKGNLHSADSVGGASDSRFLTAKRRSE